MLSDHRRPLDAPAPGHDPAAQRPSALRRFLGGSPGGVGLRLLVLSVLVGAALSSLGLTPGRLFWRLYDGARALVALAATELHDVTGWVVTGALVVVPLWLIARLLAFTR